jgi:sulfite exporter TauE/SafE
MLQFILAGFGLGALSSLHCVGMCGPLALSLPVHHLSKPQQFFSVLLYQSGRVVTYSILGCVLGFAGRRVYLAGFQQWFSILIGIFILLLVTQYWLFKKRAQPSFLTHFYVRVQKLMMKILENKSSGTFLFFGMANGLLPCAMVYVAIAGAMVTTEIANSVLFMAMFGLGTLPAMFAFSYFGQFISLPVRNSFKKAVPVFVSVMAVILILRGMNLGIPFISPFLSSPTEAAVSCH